MFIFLHSKQILKKETVWLQRIPNMVMEWYHKRIEIVHHGRWFSTANLRGIIYLSRKIKIENVLVLIEIKYRYIGK